MSDMKERLTKLIKEANQRYIYAEEQAQYLIDNGMEVENSNLTSDLTSLQNDLTSAKAEIERLEVELKAMRGAANSYKAEVERLRAIVVDNDAGS